MIKFSPLACLSLLVCISACGSDVSGKHMSLPNEVTKMEHTFRGRVEVVADPVLKASILDCLRSATMVGRREIAGRISETLVIQTTQMEMHLILRRIGPAVEIYLDGVMYESNDLYGLLQKTWP